METYNNSNTFVNILKGVGISIFVTVVSLLIFSCLLVYTNINENLMQPVVIVITGVSILLGSSIGNIKAKKNGMINGAIIAGIYVFLLYIISSIANGGNFNLNIHSIFMIGASLIGGLIGGIIGININK